MEAVTPLRTDSRRLAALALVLCAGLLLLAPAVAQAANPTVASDGTAVTVTGTDAAEDITVEDGATNTVNIKFACPGGTCPDPQPTSPCSRVRTSPPVVVCTRPAGDPANFRFPHLDVNAGAGNDVVDASGLNGLNTRLEGQANNDRLSGGSSSDSMNGGTGNDTESGGAGPDSLDAGGGGAGDDVLLGGPGDDFFFRSFGSDIISGGPGSDNYVTGGTVTLGDLLCNDGKDSDAPSTFPVTPRTVDLPEGRVQCSGSSADRDLVTGVERLGVEDPSVPQSVDFTGSGADETISGASAGGNDRFEGGGGVDGLFGNRGNDLLLARDGTVDARTDCGDNDGDRAVVDQNDPVEPNCETIERGSAATPGPVGGGQDLAGFPPPSPPLGNLPSNPNEATGKGGGDNGKTPPELEIPTPTAVVVKGKVQIRVRCVYRAKDCVGTLTLSAAENRRAGKTKVKRGQRLASGSVKVPWGKSLPTTLSAPSSLKKLLTALKGKALKVTATVVARDGAAAKRATAATVKRKVSLGILAGKPKRIKLP